jgi:hypothetical protein
MARSGPKGAGHKKGGVGLKQQSIFGNLPHGGA